MVDIDQRQLALISMIQRLRGELDSLKKELDFLKTCNKDKYRCLVLETVAGIGK